MITVVVVTFFRGIFGEVVGTPTQIAYRSFQAFFTGYSFFFIFFCIYLHFKPDAYPPHTDNERTNGGKKNV